MISAPSAASLPRLPGLLALLLQLLPVHVLSQCPVLPKDGSHVMSSKTCGYDDFINSRNQMIGYNWNVEQCLKQRVAGYNTQYMYWDNSVGDGLCYVFDRPCASCGDGGNVWYAFANLSAIDSPPSTLGQGRGDPHFVDARGKPYDFKGELGKTFCLISDKSVHINALIDGYYHAPAAKAGGKSLRTWMKEIGLLWKDAAGLSHVVVLKARRGIQVKRGGQGLLESVILDGVSQKVPLQVNKEVKEVGGFYMRLRKGMVVGHGTKSRQKDVYSLHIEGVMDAEISLTAELVGLRQAHNAQVHFNFKIFNIQSMPDIHGILWQTYMSGVVRVAQSMEHELLSKVTGGAVAVDDGAGAGFLYGNTASYRTTSITSADCQVTQFAI